MESEFVVDRQLPHRSWLALALAVLAAMIATLLTTTLSEGLRPKSLVAAGGGVALLVWAFRSGRPKAVFLGAWAFALTYNRQYFVFEPIVGKFGAQGPYMIAADAFLLLLAGMWLWDAVVLKVHARPSSRSSGILWLIPFLVVSFISGMLSIHTAWSMSEVLRLLRICFVLIYFRYQTGPEEWWACVIGMSSGATLQALMGVLEVATGRTGILGILGIGANLEDAAPIELRQESFYGWRRATGTMSHPPNLACYFLMVLPIIFALGCAVEKTKTRLICFGALLVGIAGLGCTLSRWPWAVMAFQLALVLIVLVGMRVVRPQIAIGMTAVALCVGAMVLAPMADFIADRMTRDLSRSVDFRVRENDTGLRIAEEHPVWGVGPNNYRDYLLKYEPEWQWALQYEEMSIKLLHIRPIAAPHNGFLLILAETGALGLLTFSIFVIGVAIAGVRAVVRTEGMVRAVCVGLLAGLVGLLLQQAVDFSIWADPLLYTLALMAALCFHAPRPLAEEGPLTA